MSEARFNLVINGKLEGAEATIGVVNPSTEEVFAHAPDATREQLDRAVVAARNAQREWAALPFAQRSQTLNALAAALENAAQSIAPVLVAEQGKPIAHAIGEIMGAAAMIREATKVVIADQVLSDAPGQERVLSYQPLGVIGAITPWNFPIILAVQKVADALQAGNTMVLKPSPYTPLATLMLGEVAAQVLPAGVLNVLSGGNDLGAWMTGHDGIDMISFTGSSPTGKAVAASAMSSSLKRVLLELGGNDPAIVMADADIEAAAPKLFRAAFTNSGQVCMAVKRVYVHESRIDELTDKLATLAKAQVLGDGMTPDTTLGPVQNAMQFEKVMELVNDARDAGAEFVTGGHALNRPGYFIAPTIVRGIEDGVRLVDEEQFGPVLPLVAFTDVEDAISRANNSCYGLSASVWTADAAVGRAIAARLEAGTVWVNKHLEPALDAPFGGAKESGIGRSQGELGAKAYMEPKVIDLIAQA